MAEKNCLNIEFVQAASKWRDARPRDGLWRLFHEGEAGQSGVAARTQNLSAKIGGVAISARTIYMPRHSTHGLWVFDREKSGGDLRWR